jgi:uncharacterized membrane protein YccC
MSEVVWFVLASFTVVTLRRILRILERQERSRVHEAFRLVEERQQKAREHEMFRRIQGG